MTVMKENMPPKITTLTLQKMKKERRKITALTCYDASMAKLLNACGVDVVLVGDSVGNVRLGYGNTLPVTLEEMAVHTRAARRGNSTSLLVSDMPFLSYELDAAEAARAAGRLVKSGGAEAVKLEGAGPAILKSIRRILSANIPVMGHVGLTPQSVHRLGGYRVQGRDKKSAQATLSGALALEKTGVFAIVLEAVPADLAARITRRLKIPTIGIGAGAGCDGQILVIDDMLGLSEGPAPRFVKQYAALRRQAGDAVKRYCRDVRSGNFPGREHTY
jgi:3-methyl-2-oxobutanoate hydroxymethyltransferase